MARVREPEEPKATAIIASATVLSGRSKKSHKKISPQAWQMDAWAWYDTIGEFRYAVAWVGNLLSKVKLTVTKDGEPVTDGPAVEALELLFGGPEGQVEMMRQMGIHMTVAGDCYVVAEGKGEEIDDDWYVIAATEMKGDDDQGWKAGKKEFDNPLVIRTWKPHPRKHSASDSPTRAVLPILAEIEGLTKHVAAQIDSRLAGAGMLVMPSEITFTSSSTSTVGEGETPGQTDPQSSANKFIQTLGETMTKAIDNRESAAALVPFLVQASGEHLDKIRLIQFWSELDKQAIDLRKEAIGRLALGMDMPPEALTGTADMNHWNAWSMEEASIKSHTEPLIKIITSNLTVGYLRPFLEGSDMDSEEAAHYSITADTTALRLRPNRSKEAVELYDRGELNAAALLRENGFDPADAMDDAEREQWLTRKVAGGSTTPELVGQALKMLGLAFDLPKPEIVEVQEARPRRSIAEHPVTDIPEEPVEDGLAAAITAGQVYVLRALERAGNRMKTRHGSFPPGALAINAYMYYDALDRESASALVSDAWNFVDQVDCGVPTEFLRRELHEFTTTLIADRRKFDAGILRDYLTARAQMEGVCT